ncbi:acylphosphatase [Aquibacillus sediminis]|uniref:acylphosphatase n=1 Tax=Aquibacillus sediminis TaxID=2574734 RepID=UPI00319E570F
MIRIHMIVSGRVQGVGFRITTQLKASEMGVTGWVRNRSDGTVELEAEGPPNIVYPFVEFIENGPSRFIKVEHVEKQLLENTKGYTTFDIK